MTQEVTVTPTRSTLSRITSAGLAILGSLLWLVSLVGFATGVRQFEDIFAKFEADLPALTRAEIGFARAVVEFWFLWGAAWLAATVGLASWSALTRSRWGVWVASIWVGCSLLTLVVTVVLLVIGMFPPLIWLVQSVGARR